MPNLVAVRRLCRKKARLTLLIDFDKNPLLIWSKCVTRDTTGMPNFCFIAVAETASDNRGQVHKSTFLCYRDGVERAVRVHQGALHSWASMSLREQLHRLVRRRGCRNCVVLMRCGDTVSDIFIMFKLKCRQYPAIHTNYSCSNCTISN